MQISTFELQCSLMFRQPPSPDSKRPPEQQTPQPISTGQIRTEKPEQCYQWGKLSLPHQLCNSRWDFEWKIGTKNVPFFFYELQEFNVYFTDTEQSFCSFIYFVLLQVSAMVQASQSGSKCPKCFKINSCFFFSSNKNIWCISTPSLMSSTCKHLVYLEGWWTI